MTIDRRLGDAAIEIAVAHAASWARGLVTCHGMRPATAATLAARRHGVSWLDVLARLPKRADGVWLHASMHRPTSRPSRGEGECPLDLEDVDPEISRRGVGVQAQETRSVASCDETLENKGDRA